MQTNLKPLQLAPALVIYGCGALLLFAATHLAIPLVQQVTRLNPLVTWFICGGLFVFLPMFVAALVLVRQEGAKTVRDFANRLWLFPLSRQTWTYSLAAALLVMVSMGLIVTVAPLFIDNYSPGPPFMKASKLHDGELWVLAAWLPFFFFNIIGEELFWRGYMWPRLAPKYKNRTWMVSALGWGIFHVSFGWMLFLTLLPILIIQPYVMQKTQNTWSGIIIHGTVNGVGFLMVTVAGLH